jgi:ferrous iron transport protein A
LKSLIDLKSGTRAIIRQLRGGREFSSRMAGLGFSPYTEVIVIQNHFRGPIIVEVRETRVALGRIEAGKVLIETGSED